MNYVNVTFVLCAILCNCESSKILAIFPMPAHSHHVTYSKLVKKLAKRGHEVTFVNPYPQKAPLQNLKEISVESIIDTINERKKHFYGLETQTVLLNAVFLTNMGHLLTEKVLEHENVQKLLRSKEHYDLVLVAQYLNEALLGIAHHFKAPVVLVTSMPLWSWSSFQLAHLAPPSYVPNLLSPYTGHMDFWQRLSNSFYDAFTILYHQWVVLPKHRDLVKKYITGEPDLYDFLNNASLILINSHMSTYEAMPQVPNAVEIGGLHIDESEALAVDLRKFLDQSVDGVVIFSMGSNLKSSDLPEFKRDEILKAFAKLKQNVLWKWEKDDLPGLPKNVKLMKWLPQSAVLAHPNIKAFLTHGGLMSTMESIYYGVPCVGIPIFADQKMNMATAVSYEYGVVVPFQELTEERLSLALNQVLNDPKYKNNVMRRSKIMRDRPMKPLDTAVYWIEYVIRHQGAPHLRYPGMNLAWYQRNLLDVVAFVALATIVSTSLVLVLFKRILRRFSKVNGKKKMQ